MSASAQVMVSVMWTHLIGGTHWSRVDVALVRRQIHQVESDYPSIDVFPVRQRSRFIPRLVESSQGIVVALRLTDEGLPNEHTF